MVTIDKRRLKHGYLHSVVALSPFGHLSQDDVPFGVSQFLPTARLNKPILNPVSRLQKIILRQP